MELGEKLLRARLEAGLSQRQLCGDEITRNMLSQIEHGTAKPSVGTLQYLAGRLGKPVSYFLEEKAVLSQNQELMEQVRRYYDGEKYALALDEIKQYRGSDEVFDRERQLLEVLCRLALAETAIREGREPYARELLEGITTEKCYCAGDLERRKWLLLGKLRGQKLEEVCKNLPSLDEELFLRAEAALAAGDPDRAARLLDAAEERTPRWYLLRGESDLKRQNFQGAAEWYHRAENGYPKETARRLEVCYRELRNFERAYFYACKQRG